MKNLTLPAFAVLGTAIGVHLVAPAAMFAQAGRDDQSLTKPSPGETGDGGTGLPRRRAKAIASEPADRERGGRRRE